MRIELNGEPTVDELLSDPIAQLIMRYDGIDENDVRDVMEKARLRLRAHQRAA